MAISYYNSSQIVCHGVLRHQDELTGALQSVPSHLPALLDTAILNCTKCCMIQVGSTQESWKDGAMITVSLRTAALLYSQGLPTFVWLKD